ncbi:MAG: hypothetical protein Q8Q67_04250 [bacterium]|nr:hypothetical protein [bacterium]
MTKPHFLITSVQVIMRFAWNIIFFPLWWYSLGFLRHVSKIWTLWREEERSLGLTVWVKNCFVPMYGQRDIAGRVISFFIRTVQIIARSLVLLFWIIIGLGIIIAWLALPILIILASAYQLLEK